MSIMGKQIYLRAMEPEDMEMCRKMINHRFTIPNFPSRPLGHFQAKLPVLACTDSNTDIGEVITSGGFDWWCESNSEEDFSCLISKATKADLKVLGEVAYHYLQDDYTVEHGFEHGYKKIQKRLK